MACETIAVTDDLSQPIGLLKRMACMFYDGLLAFSALMLTSLAITALTALEIEQASWTQPAMLALAAVYFGVAFAYFGWFWTHSGTTLAMTTWQIRLVSSDGTAVTWWQALRRFSVALAQWILVLGAFQAWRLDQLLLTKGLVLLIVIGLILSWRHPRKHMLHDWLSGTELARSPHPGQTP